MNMLRHVRSLLKVIESLTPIRRKTKKIYAHQLNLVYSKIHFNIPEITIVIPNAKKSTYSAKLEKFIGIILIKTSFIRLSHKTLIY